MPLTLLDFGKPNPFGRTVGNTRHLAWPVNAFRVTLPALSADREDINPFERVILKIIDAGGSPDAKELARETCIPIDLVQCVLLRLRDKAYIDEDNQIIKQKRERWITTDNHPRDFVTALVFRELATGKILPYLQVLDSGNPLKKKEDEERFFRTIRWDEVHVRSLPAPRDVISALRALQKRARAFENEMHLPPALLITIAPDAERHYLDCPIAIQKNDGEFRIADPFGHGCSLVLENAFMRLLEEDNSLADWLMSWKRSLANTEPARQAAAHQEPYDTDDYKRRYPNLVRKLRLGSNRQFRSLDQIHAALEWALFYSCIQRPYDSAIHQLTLTHPAEHTMLLQKAAEAIALKLPADGLRPVGAGKLKDFLSGKAELGTVLSIALLAAASDAAHSLRRLAVAHPDFVLQLFHIKRERDALGHGAGNVRLKEVALPEDAMMRAIVHVLLPAIRFSDTPVEVDQEAVTDALLDARTSIQSDFGFALFNSLGANLQDRLIVAERFWLVCKDGDDAQAFACDVYAALQSTFRKSLSEVLPPDIEDSEYIESARKSASACGLGSLPECLCTVKRSAIRETLQGNAQTLGSCAVAFLLAMDADTLRAIAAAHRTFIADIATVIVLRGHGNEPMPLPKDEIRKLRKATYTTIKTLLEA